MATDNKARTYAFLMVEYETPPFIEELQDKIKTEELYEDDSEYDYGLERESHITLVPCLDNDVDLDELKKYLKPLKDYTVVLTDISKFECEKYDVLKSSAKSTVLEETNKDIKKKFTTHSEYKEYKPHMTIAYLKNGLADKYTKKILDKLVLLKPKNFYFSYHDKNGNEQKVKFEK